MTLAQKSPSHLNYLQQTIIAQQNEIKRLSQIIENKSQQLFKLNQSTHRLQTKLEYRLTKARQIQKHLQLRLSEANQLNCKLQIKIRELEKALESDDLPAIKLDSHNSNLPPSLRKQGRGLLNWHLKTSRRFCSKDSLIKKYC